MVDIAEEDDCWRLFVRERHRLLGYVKRLAPAGCDGVDILQEVGLRLLAQTDMEASPDRVTAWCKTVARHIVAHELRAARYERAKVAALDSHTNSDAWESDRRAVLRSTVVRELERMDPISRDIVLRRYVLEQTSDEIARATELTAPAVRMRLMRIRDELGSRAADWDEKSSRDGDTEIE